MRYRKNSLNPNTRQYLSTLHTIGGSIVKRPIELATPTIPKVHNMQLPAQYTAMKYNIQQFSGMIKQLIPGKLAIPSKTYYTGYGVDNRHEMRY